MFQNPFEFTGRINKIEYLLSMLIYIGFYVGFITGFRYVSENTEDITEVYLILVFILLWIPFTWFLLAQATKRCHDRGNSGWFQFIPFYLLVMLFGDGDYGINKYGMNPNGVGNFQEVNDIGVNRERSN